MSLLQITLIALFSSLALSLILTPVARSLGLRFGIVDVPNERSVHSRPIPRVGGAAVFVTFMAVFVGSLLLFAWPPREHAANIRITAFAVGATCAFALGLWDDVRRLSPGVKLFWQVVAALIPCIVGVRADAISVPGLGNVPLGVLSYPISILWFLLLMNALNLIDGLDGLAAGVTCLGSLAMIFVCSYYERYISAMGFAALTGCTAGFLYYNRHPASIFLGDGGSYFIGFVVAALSLRGTVKTEAAAALLFPIIVLGLPIADTIWAVLRRLVRGRPIFSADKDHIHHKLLRYGLNQWKSVQVLYGMTLLLGLLAIGAMFVGKRFLPLVLLVSAGAIMLFARLTARVRLMSRARLAAWLRDVLDESGVCHERRRLLDLQIEIAASRSVEEIWRHVIMAARLLEADFVELSVPAGRKGEIRKAANLLHGRPPPLDTGRPLPPRALMLTLPLIYDGRYMGRLSVIKDLREAVCMDGRFLGRWEHLRRSVTSALGKLAQIRSIDTHTSQPVENESCPQAS